MRSDGTARQFVRQSGRCATSTTLVAARARLRPLASAARGVLRRETFRRYVTIEEVEQYVAGLASHAETLLDPPARPDRARSPNDDYFIALAREAAAD